MKPKTFAVVLQALLDKHQMTAYRLGKDSGVSHQNISAFLLGKCTPTVRIALKIARHLGESLAVFDGVTFDNPGEKNG